MPHRTPEQHSKEVFYATGTTVTVDGAISVDGMVTVDGGYTSPQNFIYKHLLRVSGPQSASGTDYDLDTNSNSTDSVFEYTVPADTTIDIARFNWFMTDAGIGPTDFAGIAGGLTNGCLLQIIDDDGVAVLLDFNDGVPIITNDMIAKLAGSDSASANVAGQDWYPIRFTIAKAGKNMRLTAGQIIRWTNQDNLSGITKFQFMVQGTIVT